MVKFSQRAESVYISRTMASKKEIRPLNNAPHLQLLDQDGLEELLRRPLEQLWRWRQRNQDVNAVFRQQFGLAFEAGQDGWDESGFQNSGRVWFKGEHNGRSV
jgi:hypothetical protein